MTYETLARCNFCASSNFKTIDQVANLIRCQDCGCVFVSPRPSLADLEAYYSKPSKYDGWLAELDARDALWRRRLAKISKIKRPGSLLDVGAGIGQFLHNARKEFSEVHGMEISSSAIAIAKEKYGLDIRKGTIESLAYDRTFDNITLFHVLEHVHDPKRVLEICKSLLKDGGLLVIAVPNDLNSIELKIRTFIKKLKGIKIGKYGIPALVLDGSVDEIHLSQFTPTSLSKALERLGFKVIQNSLDPYFAKTGRKLLIHQAYYKFHSFIRAVFGINLYNTIWIAAVK